MTAIALTKHEGLGNDFLIAVNPTRQLSAEDAVRWCDRHRGVGADGLIMMQASAEGSADWTMTLWNADGSRAEISGNGIRCVAQALARHQELDGPQSFSVSTDAGLRSLELTPTEDPDEVNVRVDMGAAKPGPPDFDDWADLGVEVQRQVGIDMGNPHLVALVVDVAAHDIATVGPAVEANYPDGLNVHLIEVTTPDHLTLHVWERGAGVTEACGSGACAAGVAAEMWGLTTGPVQVKMPGGAVVVEVRPEQEGGTVLLTGPARFIAEVSIHG